MGEEEAAPAIAALCIRLSAYAEAIHPGVCNLQVAASAIRAFRTWAYRIEANDADAIDATLATDPINLILATYYLPDSALGTKCRNALHHLWQKCMELGVSPVSRRNRAALIALLPPHSPLARSDFLCDPASDEELALELTPFACATLAIAYSRSMARASPHLSEQRLAAAALCSVWRRDLAGAGLCLLASALIFGEPRPSGLLAWVGRIARTDGFMGMWQLYGNVYERANLLGTLNIYWGLAALEGSAWPEVMND